MPEYLPGRFLPWEREEKEEGGRGKKKEKRGGREKRRYFGPFRLQKYLQKKVSGQ